MYNPAGSVPQAARFTPRFAGQPGAVRHGRLKKIVRQKNKLRRFDTYALSEAQLLEAKAKGIAEVELLERETGRTFISPVDRILREGERFQHPGYEVQRALPLHLWAIDEPGQQDLPLA